MATSHSCTAQSYSGQAGEVSWGESRVSVLGGKKGHRGLEAYAHCGGAHPVPGKVAGMGHGVGPPA